MNDFPSVQDPLDFLNDATSIKTDEKMDDLEMIDKVCTSLSAELQSFGFPDCGNLRSTKKKDVKMRIKAYQMLLRQRRKDLDFRSSFQEKFKKYDVD